MSPIPASYKNGPIYQTNHALGFIIGYTRTAIKDKDLQQTILKTIAEIILTRFISDLDCVQELSELPRDVLEKILDKHRQTLGRGVLL